MMPMDLDAAALNLMRLRISRITATLARGRKADILDERNQPPSSRTSDGGVEVANRP
jgi:hypothetical protein